MLYEEEVIFIKKLLASLRIINIERMPFSNEQFQKGIEEMHEYLENSLTINKYDEISLLFLKKPIRGSYDRLVDGMMNLNGSLIKFVSLQNPIWEEAVINMNEIEANDLLSSDDDFIISEEIIKEAAFYFCKGAQIIAQC